jgi:hypothetical protein
LVAFFDALVSLRANSTRRNSGFQYLQKLWFCRISRYPFEAVLFLSCVLVRVGDWGDTKYEGYEISMQIILGAPDKPARIRWVKVPNSKGPAQNRSLMQGFVQ